MAENKNIAARAARWSASHRKTAIWGWLAFVIVLVMVGSAVGTKSAEQDEGGPGESGRADKTLHDAFPKASDESVLVQSGRYTAGDPQFRAAVRDAMATVDAQAHVRDVKNPYRSGDVSDDRHAALVNFEVAGKASVAEDRVGAVTSAVKKVDARHDAIRVEQFGEASAGKALSDRFAEDFQKAEGLSLPLTLLILIVAFGALVAAGIPLLLAATAVAATIGLIGPISQLVPVDEAIGSVVLLIGLAVGVDYSMFYLRREREERANGLEERAALAVAAATSGRAVLVSGMTVVIAMAGMFLGGSRIWTAFAIGTILVVAFAVIGSLTVLPAMLAWLGDRVEKGRVPILGRRKRAGGDSRAWGFVIDRVMRRPLVSAVLATGFLLVLAAPVLGMKTALPGLDTYPRDISVMQTYDRIQQSFPGSPIPATVAVQADNGRSADMRTAIGDMRRAAVASGDFSEPVTVKYSRDGASRRCSSPSRGTEPTLARPRRSRTCARTSSRGRSGRSMACTRT